MSRKREFSFVSSKRRAVKATKIKENTPDAPVMNPRFNGKQKNAVTVTLYQKNRDSVAEYAY